MNFQKRHHTVKTLPYTNTTNGNFCTRHASQKGKETKRCSAQVHGGIKKESVCVCDWGVWPGAREEDGVCVCMH